MEIVVSNISKGKNNSYMLVTQGYEVPSHRVLTFYMHFYFFDDRVEYSYSCRTSVNYKKTTFCFSSNHIYEIPSIETMVYSKEEIIKEIVNKTDIFDKSIKIMDEYCEKKNWNVHRTVYILGDKEGIEEYD
jgi:hypothetical protein